VSKRAARWLPAVAVSAVIAVGSFTMGSQAGAVDDLPAKSAAEILALIGEHDVRAFSGAVEQTSDLGIPEIPAELGAPGAGGASALELLTASHTARVYVDRPRLRLQVLDRLGERDLIVTDEDVWFYDSAENTATRLQIPAEMPVGDLPEGLLHGFAEGHSVDDVAGPDPSSPDLPFGAGATPVEIADDVLASVGSSTQVTVGAETAVAGRPAYSLVLTPLSTETLVGSISVAADAETGMPLSVVVRARGQEAPAWSTTFTSLTLEAPDPARFEFTPPPGATIEEPLGGGTLGDASPTPDDAGQTEGTTPDGAVEGPGPEPTVHGTGWDTVIEVPVGPESESVLQDPLLMQLATEVPGGHALTTSLLSVLVTDDGRVLAGSVTVDRLRAVAAE
jgi:outer membrane lipoprotein-sorting protein